MGAEDQLLVDNAIMDEMRNNKTHMAVAFYDCQKAYDMESILNALKKLISGRKTRLEHNEGGKLQASSWIKISKGFLQGDSYSPVGFCLTEVPVAMFLEEVDSYRMGLPGERKIKRTQFI